MSVLVCCVTGERLREEEKRGRRREELVGMWYSHLPISLSDEKEVNVLHHTPFQRLQLISTRWRHEENKRVHELSDGYLRTK